MKFKRFFTAMACFLLLSVLIAGGCSLDKPPAPKGKFVVGSKAYTEQLIMGHIASLILKDLGYDVVSEVPLAGTHIIRKDLEAKKIDGYFEYTGTGALFFSKEKPQFKNPRDLYRFVAENDLKNNLVWLEPLSFNNTYCLMLRQKDAAALGIETLSDLTRYLNENQEKVKIAVSSEFPTRADGLPKWRELYGLKVSSATMAEMEPGLIYTALKEGVADAGIGFSTDGRIVAYDLKAVADDQGMFPIYNPCFVLRKEFLDKDPAIKEQFKKLIPILDEPTITRLNFEVDENKKAPRQVAEAFLKKHNIIK